MFLNRLFVLGVCICARSFVGGDFTSPCSVGEQASEVQDVDGLVCTAACNQETLACPSTLAKGYASRPMCMLRDTKETGHCALLCSKTSDCPDGTRCLQIAGFQVNVCAHTSSFSDWVKEAPDRVQKLTFGLPSKLAHGAALTKAKAAVENLKQRYSIPNTDLDLSTVQQGVESIVTAASLDIVASAMLTMMFTLSSSEKGLGPSAWNQDMFYAKHRLLEGPSGLKREISDTVNDLTHLQEYGSATRLLRGFIELALVYLAFGAVYKSQALGATGLDMIPHIGFWRQYPSLVVDGVGYVQSLIQGKSYSPGLESSFISQPIGYRQVPAKGASTSLDSYEQML